MSELGRVLKLARELKGETLRSLADKAGVSNALISQIENGRCKSPGFESVVRLARALNVPLSHFEKTVLDLREILRRKP